MKKHPYIMVVDDDQKMLRMLKRTLEANGYGIATATDGSSALAILEERRPDLVILDIMMPEFNGLQVLNVVRQHSNVPVIKLTARCEVPPFRKTLVTGANDYMIMPFQTRELVTRVKAKLRCAG